MTYRYSVVDYRVIDGIQSIDTSVTFTDNLSAAKFLDQYRQSMLRSDPSGCFVEHNNYDPSQDKLVIDNPIFNEFGTVIEGYALYRTSGFACKILLFAHNMEDEMKDNNVKPEQKVRWVAKNLSNTEKTYHDTRDEAITEALGWLFSYQYAIGDAQPESRMYTIDEISIIELRWPDEPDEDIMSYEIYTEPIPMYQVTRKVEGLEPEILLTTEHNDRAIETAQRYITATIGIAKSYSLIYEDRSDKPDNEFDYYMKWVFIYLNNKDGKLKPPVYRINIIK